MEKQANVTVSASADSNLSAHAQHQAAVQHELHMQHLYLNTGNGDVPRRTQENKMDTQILRENEAYRNSNIKGELVKKAITNAAVAEATAKREAKKLYNSLQNKPSRVNTSKGVARSKAMSRGSLASNSTKPVASEDDVLRLIAQNASKRRPTKPVASEDDVFRLIARNAAKRRAGK